MRKTLVFLTFVAAMCTSAIGFAEEPEVDCNQVCTDAGMTLVSAEKDNCQCSVEMASEVATEEVALEAGDETPTDDTTEMAATCTYDKCDEVCEPMDCAKFRSNSAGGCTYICQKNTTFDHPAKEPTVLKPE